MKMQLAVTTTKLAESKQETATQKKERLAVEKQKAAVEKQKAAVQSWYESVGARQCASSLKWQSFVQHAPRWLQERAREYAKRGTARKSDRRAVDDF